MTGEDFHIMLHFTLNC